MKIILVFILQFFVIPVSTVLSQFDYSVSGYVVDLPVYQRSPDQMVTLFNIDKDMFMNLNRVRLKPEMFLWSGSRLNIEYEISSLYYTSETPFEFVTGRKTNRQAIDLTWNVINEKEFLLNHYIDRFYLRQNFNWGNITLGRQRISWGSGRIWNPTDLFNPINPANFAKIEKDGADAVSLTWNAGNFTDINLVFNAREKINKSNSGMRFRTNYNEFDLSTVIGRFDEHYIIGLDFAGNLLTAGVRGEGIYSVDKDNSENNFIKYILGIDYQFTTEIYALLEYHFNGEGKTNKNNYEFMRLVTGEILNLNRNYLYAGITYQFNPLLMLMISNVTNLNDKSGYIGVTGNYSVTENFYLNLGIQTTYGQMLTEYWYYPHSFYLQGEYYF